MRTYIDKLLRGEIDAPSVARLVGFDAVSVDDQQAVFQLDVDPDKHANPMGTLHGGILCDLADAAMGMAYGYRLDEGDSFTTLELKINFLRPVWKGRITATGRVVQGGRSVGMTECDVIDDAGRLIARATATNMTLRGDQARGR